MQEFKDIPNGTLDTKEKKFDIVQNSMILGEIQRHSKKALHPKENH